MQDLECPVPEHPALSPRRSAKGRTPSGYRVLHVIVPEQIFNHVKAQAYLSGLRFPEYVARFLEEAWPYKESRPQQPQASLPPEIVETGNSQP